LDGWRSGGGGLADAAAANAQQLRATFLAPHTNGRSASAGGRDGRDGASGSGAAAGVGASGSMGFTVNPLFRNATGAVAAEANGLGHREETAAQVVVTRNPRTRVHSRSPHI
jgi:hypothetical protein